MPTVTSWVVEVLEGRSSTVRDRLGMDAMGSRLKSASWEAQAAPGGLLPGGLTLTTAQPITAALLDTVRISLDGAVVYRGRVSKLPPLQPEDNGTWTYSGDGQLVLSRTIALNLSLSDYSGLLWPRVKDLLVSAFQVTPAPELADDSLGSIEHWALEQRQNVRLDSFCDDLNKTVGGDLMYGFRLDGTFVIGRRPNTPQRTLTDVRWEGREAQLANRIICTTGVDYNPTIVVMDQASVSRDGPISEVEDMSASVGRSVLTLARATGAHLEVTYASGATALIPATLTRAVSASQNEATAADGLAISAQTIVAHVGYHTESGTHFYYQSELTFDLSSLPVTGTPTGATLRLEAVPGTGEASPAGTIQVRPGGVTWYTRAQLQASAPLAQGSITTAGFTTASIPLPASVVTGSTLKLHLNGLRNVNMNGPEGSNSFAPLRPSTVTTGLEVSPAGKEDLLIATPVAFGSGDHLELAYNWPGGTNRFNASAQVRVTLLSANGSSQTLYGPNIPADSTDSSSGVPISTWTAHTGNVQNAVVVPAVRLRVGILHLIGGDDETRQQPVGLTSAVGVLFGAVITAAENLLLTKYGPTLNATSTLHDWYEPCGGAGIYNLPNGEHRVLLDAKAAYTLDEDGFKTVITGGSSTRYTPGQRARVEIERVAKAVQRLGGTP